jgi:hypothetical protein
VIPSDALDGYAREGPLHGRHLVVDALLLVLDASRRPLTPI